VLEGFPRLSRLSIDPSMLVWLVLFFLAGYFLFAVVMAAAGAMTTSLKEGQQISLLVTLPAMAPLMFFQLVAGNPDGVLARVLSFVPITAPMTMTLRLGATDVAMAEAAVSLLVTVLSGLVMLWGSARVFRSGLLMYGQKMTLSNILAALREA